MGKEIEHKYLVTDDSYKAMAVETRARIYIAYGEWHCACEADW